MWFKKKAAQNAQLDAIMSEWRGRIPGEWLETASGTVHVDYARQPPTVERRRELLCEAAELIDAGLPAAAQVLKLGLEDWDTEIRRAARVTWCKLAKSRKLPPEVPDADLGACVEPPIRGCCMDYDARWYLRFAETFEPANTEARRLLQHTHPDWVALLIRRSELDGDDVWDADVPLIALGVGPAADSESPAMESAEHLMHEVRAGKPAAPGRPTAETRSVGGHPACVIDKRVFNVGPDFENFCEREYVIFVGKHRLGISAWSSEADWAAHERDFEALIDALEMPPLVSPPDDDKSEALNARQRPVLQQLLADIGSAEA